MGSRCPNCGNTDENYMTFMANWTLCNKCDKEFSTIEGKPTSEFCFTKCPKCSSTSLQVACSGKRLCNGCMYFWMPGEEAEGHYLNGEPTENTPGACPGDINKLLNTKGAKACSCGCCNCKKGKQYEEEQKKPETKKAGGCCGGCCGKSKAACNMNAVKKDMESVEVPDDPEELPAAVKKIKAIMSSLASFINPS